MTIEAVFSQGCNLSCGYSLAAGTKVLLLDPVRWIPIEDVEVGDRVVGFDEHRPGKGRHRKFVESTVTALPRHRDKLMVIHLADGRKIRATESHRWLMKHGRWRETGKLKSGSLIHQISTPVDSYPHGRRYEEGYLSGVTLGDGTAGHYASGQSVFRLAVKDVEILDRCSSFMLGACLSARRVVANLGHGYTLPALETRRRAEVERWIVTMGWWSDDPEWKAGWLAGLFDAEGTAHQCRISQKDLSVLERAAGVLKADGFRVRIVKRSTREMHELDVLGGLHERIRFFALYGPALQRKIKIEGQGIYGTAEVVGVTKDGWREHDVFDLTTTSGTFVAEGLTSHNCYEHPYRDADNIGKGYDLDKMKEALERHGHSFTLFGGEPLATAKIEDIEELWRWGHEKWGSNSIQTNAVLITPRVVDAMVRYGVVAGVSMDGPGDLNRGRWSGSMKATDRDTAKSMRGIQMMCQAGIPVSMIVTLHRGNALPEMLPRMAEWFCELGEMGIRDSRLHLMEIDHAGVRDWRLTDQENIDAMLFFRDLDCGISFDVFGDIRAKLTGDDGKTSCVWNNCDPFTTQAVQGVNGDGTASNCGRADHTGVDWFKAEEAGYERYLALYSVPQEHGGCQGCRFFLMCTGECPGSAIDGDWRNRTEYCEVWKHLYTVAEREMLDEGLIPLSVSPMRKSLEEKALVMWSEGRNSQLAPLLRTNQAKSADGSHANIPHQDRHENHYNQVARTTRGWQRVGQGDVRR